MCGISGIFHFDNKRQVNKITLKRMSDIIGYRGPDDDGLYINNNIGLAHKRLSILDLSNNGSQPMSSLDNRYQIVFNGEIYNYMQLRTELSAKGYKFKSKTDTEVLLNLYIEHGKLMLHKLNGMFSFVIWDNIQHEIFAARDRLGIKPFYYYVHDNTFYFSSEQKSFFVSGLPKVIRESSLEELILYRNISGEVGIFKNVKKLLPGHFLFASETRRISIERWWNLSEKIKEIRSDFSHEDIFNKYENLFYSAVKYRNISDVPVGVLLSGGLDSSSIVIALNKIGVKNINTFTVSFDDKKHDESALAKLVAKTYNMKFHSINLEGSDLIENLLKAVWVHDEPLMHQNDAQLLAISNYAKKYVSVLMSGEGGDELMGGYVRYKALKYPIINKILNPLLNITPEKFLNNRLVKLNKFLSINSNYDKVLLNSCSLYPRDFENYGINVSPYCSQYRNKMLNEAMSVYNNDFPRQTMYLDQHTYLNSLFERNDRTTMAASIECRVPFNDHRLVELLGAVSSKYLISGKKGKRILLNSVGKNLPKKIRNFKKVGFSVPWEKYLRTNEFFKESINMIKKSEIFEFEIFRKLNLNKIISDFQKGSNKDSAIIRQFLMISLWYDNYYKKFK